MPPLPLSQHLAASAASLLGLFIVLVASTALAQDEPVNVVTPPTSDYVVDGTARSRLELVRDDGANGPSDLQVRTASGVFPCHLPCMLDVPSGNVHLWAEGLDQRFELLLPVARFRVRAGEPTPWLESIGAIAGGVGASGVGLYLVLNPENSEQFGGGVALLILGGLLLGVGIVALVLGVMEESGSVELDTFEAALREGVVRF
jgi:hypothetical protein